MTSNSSPDPAKLFIEINQEILELYQCSRMHISPDSPGFGRTSTLWNGKNNPPFTQRMLRGPILDAIRFVQNTSCVYLSHNRGSVDAGICAEELVHDLESTGFDLDSCTAEIQESPFTNPNQIMHYHGRPVSVDFLYRLNICQRFLDMLNRSNIVVLEIGAGLGTLARTVRLLKPNVKYVIVDLLDTMALSYSFLRANFPDATTLFVTDRAQLAQVDATPDYTFIPAELVPFSAGEGGHDIPRLNIDLVVNTFSIGEMRQEVAEAYVNLIQNRLNVTRFYSLNRHLEPGPLFRHNADEQIGTYCLPLDPYWEVLRWEYSPAFVGHVRVGEQEVTLEFYGERTSPDSVDSDALRRLSLELLDEAQKLGDYQGHQWHRLMWDSIRLYPSKENVEPITTS